MDPRSEYDLIRPLVWTIAHQEPRSNSQALVQSGCLRLTQNSATLKVAANALGVSGWHLPLWLLLTYARDVSASPLPCPSLSISSLSFLSGPSRSATPRTATTSASSSSRRAAPRTKSTLSRSSSESYSTTVSTDTQLRPRLHRQQ